MRAARDRSIGLAAVAEIRALQSRAAELDAVRAGNERRAAAEARDAGQRLVAEIELGWAGAVEDGAFDPDLSRHWFRALETARADERRLEEEADAAEAALRASQAEWKAAIARAEAADEQARMAARTAARRRDEARLGAVEDRAATQWSRR